jgi:50S ribosomal protein L16 3-hydroxylase
VHNLITEFDFIPRWRFDDVMISYAATGGSVGPHFDYYDVFLLQGTGRRRWHLSTQDCELGNYLRKSSHHQNANAV